MPFVWIEILTDQFIRSDRIDGVAVRTEIVSDKGADTAVPVMLITVRGVDRAMRFPSYPNALDRQREIMQAVQDSEDAAPASAPASAPADPRQAELALSDGTTREIWLAELRARWAAFNEEFEKATE